MATFHSGKNSTAFVGTATATVELATTNWRVNEAQESATFRNSLTGRVPVYESTFASCSFSISCDKNFAASVFTTAGGGISINVGNTNAVRLYYDRVLATNGAYWDFPQALVTSIGAGTSSEGKPTDEYNFVASGAWVEPAL